MHWFNLNDLYFLAVVILIKFGQWSRSRGLCDALANTIARIACAFPGQKRRSTATSLARCLGSSYTREQRDGILKDTYRTFWQDAFELASQPLSAHEPARRVRVDGMEHLQEALKHGHGAILLESSFFGRRNLSKILLHQHGIAILQVHGPRHVAGFLSRHETRLCARVIRPFFEGRELQFVKEIIHLSDDSSLAFTRRLVNSLQENQVLCLSGEGDIGQKSVKLHFLGQERHFVTGVMSLGKYSGAPVLPLFCWRDADNQVKLMIESSLDLQRGFKAAEAGAATYARLLETYALRHPSEYCGWHSQS
jgi:lauroyl/myristoyl acyltransferase